MSKVLLIGNSEAIYNPPWQFVPKLIDNFPGLVVRMNHYDLKEGQAGTRTDLWMIREWRFEEMKLHCLPIPEYLWRDRVIVPTEGFIRKTRKLIGANPTLGFLAMRHFLEQDNFVFLHGFDFYGNKEKVGNHRPLKEKKYIEELEKEDKHLLFWKMQTYNIPQEQG